MQLLTKEAASGFGASANNATTSGNTTGFGARSSLFGQNTNSGSLFGSTNTGSTTSAFGGGFGAGNNSGANTTNNTASSSGFGAPATSGSLFGGGGGGFGANAATSFGQSNANANQNNGTAAVPFTATQEKEGLQTSYFQSITFQPQYSKYSFEVGYHDDEIVRTIVADT